MTDRDKVERAPERIWLSEDRAIDENFKAFKHEVEFVRADLFTALQAERDALLAKVRELGTEGHAYRRGKLAGYEAGKLERDALREALREIIKTDDAGDMMFHRDGPCATIARAALHQTERDG